MLDGDESGKVCLSTFFKCWFCFSLSEHEEIKEEFCTALTSLTNLSAVLAEMVVDVTQSEP